MTVLYDANMPFYKVLSMWKGTCLVMVVTQPSFWVLMVIHGILQALEFHVNRHDTEDDTKWQKNGLDAFLPVLSYPVVGTLTSLVVFFTVFYSTQCYDRLRMFWGHCIGLGGNCMNWVGMVRNQFPGDTTLQWNAARYMLGALHIQYYSLDDGGKPIDNHEWETMLDRGFFTDKEAAELKQYKGFKPWLSLLWALQEIDTALSHKEELTGNAIARKLMLDDFRKIAFDFRGHCGHLTNWVQQPVPFAYFHVLTVMQYANLLLISYALVTLFYHWALTAVLYILICVSFLGLKETGIAMSDPFGDDDNDFELEKLLNGAYRNAVACLQNNHAPFCYTVPKLRCNPLDGLAEQPDQATPATGPTGPSDLKQPTEALKPDVSMPQSRPIVSDVLLTEEVKLQTLSSSESWSPSQHHSPPGESPAISDRHGLPRPPIYSSEAASKVDGTFRCLGTTQQIKDNHGSGYELTLKYAAPPPELTRDQYMEQNVASFTQFLQQNNYPVQQTETNSLNATFVLNIESHQLANFMRAVEQFSNHSKMQAMSSSSATGLLDWFITQQTLERVFNHFAATSENAGRVVPTADLQVRYANGGAVLSVNHDRRIGADMRSENGVEGMALLQHNGQKSTNGQQNLAHGTPREESTVIDTGIENTSESWSKGHFSKSYQPASLSVPSAERQPPADSLYARSGDGSVPGPAHSSAPPWQVEWK